LGIGTIEPEQYTGRSIKWVNSNMDSPWQAY